MSHHVVRQDENLKKMFLGHRHILESERVIRYQNIELMPRILYVTYKALNVPC
jgi:hypothetical protein